MTMTTLLDSHPGALGEAPDLTARELQVLRVWRNSPSKALAAFELRLSENTVRTHIQRIRAKYAFLGHDVSTKEQLLDRAYRDGLLTR